MTKILKQYLIHISTEIFLFSRACLENGFQNEIQIFALNLTYWSVGV